MISTRWGIDLGGTKIEGVVLETEAGGMYRELCRERIPTEGQLGYRHIIARIDALIRDMERRTGLPRPRRIGIGTPGITDSGTGLLKNSNTTCLNQQPLRRDLSQALGMEVVLQNDANCFALAEAHLGAGRGLDPVFGVILGTGVGGGVVVGGRALAGRHGIAGEWGHNILEEGGAPCYCGKRGCVETVISGPALERDYEARAGTRRPLREVARRAREGDVHASETIGHLCRSFGRAISFVLNILDPEAVVIGGGVGNIDELYGDLVRDEMRRHIFNGEVLTAIRKPELLDSAGVIGAALLV